MHCVRESARRWPSAVRARTFVLIVTVAAAGGHTEGASQQTPPVVRGQVELVTIDVQVSPAKDAAMRDLTMAEFDIRISGRKRPAASATLLHYDEGTVTRDSTARGADSSPECVFGFHRKVDRRTAHYLVGVGRTDADTQEVKDVRVGVVDQAFVVQRVVWRSPIRRSPLLAGAK
jgi:hypothetical protein